MAFDRHGTGLTLLRILLGVFFLVAGLGKLRWFIDPSLLSQQLATWEHGVRVGSISAQYLQRVAVPFSGIFARLVPLGEISAGLAMILGFWTAFFGFVAFVMVVNFHIASGVIFTYGFLTSGYGLPVIGGTLALAMGGVRLPWSIRSKS
jgi:uncharacterized membrane protein YphA (DoxX/SURF4 family)